MSDALDSTSHEPQPKKRRDLTLGEKIAILDEVKKCGNVSATGRKFGLDRRHVQKMKEKEKEIRLAVASGAQKCDRKRLKRNTKNPSPVAVTSKQAKSSNQEPESGTLAAETAKESMCNQEVMETHGMIPHHFGSETMMQSSQTAGQLVAPATVQGENLHEQQTPLTVAQYSTDDFSDSLAAAQLLSELAAQPPSAVVETNNPGYFPNYQPPLTMQQQLMEPVSQQVPGLINRQHQQIPYPSWSGSQLANNNSQITTPSVQRAGGVQLGRAERKQSSMCSQEGCDREVEVRCRICSKFSCYRCSTKPTCSRGGTGSSKHIPENLQDILLKANNELEKWQSRQTCRLQLVKDYIEKHQAKLDNELSEINGASEEVQRITTIEKICKQSVCVLPPTMIESMRLEYVSTLMTGSECISVTHHEDSILLGCHEGLNKYDRKTEEMRLLKSGIVNVAQYNGDIFISHRKSGFVPVMKYSETATDHLFSFTKQSNFPYFLSISDSYVAVVDHDNEQIKLYNRQTRHVSDITLPNTIHVYNLCFTSDGSLLVTSCREGHDSDTENGSDDGLDNDDSHFLLTKYRVEPESASGGAALTQLWSVEEDAQVYGVAESESGLIFLCSVKNKTIYIYSGEGRKLKEMRVDELPDEYDDISIKGDELAVAGWDEDSLLLFKIVY